MSYLVLAALLPAFLLLFYIYRLDKIEKEPTRLLFVVFILGIFSCALALVSEIVMEVILTSFIEESSLIYIVISNFIGVALMEEFWKRWAVRRGVWKNPNFNYHFDAIVYSVFAALGFAAIENVLYVFEGGLITALLRAVTAVPSHAIDGVTMGYFLGLAKTAELDDDKKRRNRYLRLSILVPTLEHGFYDCALSLDSGWMMLAWLIFVIVVDIWAFLFVRKAAREDQPL